MQKTSKIESEILNEFMEYYSTTPSKRSGLLPKSQTVSGRRNALERVVRKYADFIGRRISLDEMVQLSDEKQEEIARAIRSVATTKPGASSSQGEDTAYRALYEWARKRDVPGCYKQESQKITEECRVEAESINADLIRVTPEIIAQCLLEHEVETMDADELKMRDILYASFCCKDSVKTPWFRPNVWAAMYVDEENNPAPISSYSTETDTLFIRGDKETKSNISEREISCASSLFPGVFPESVVSRPYKLFRSNHTQQLSSLLGSILRRAGVNEHACYKEDLNFRDMRHIKSAWALSELDQEQLQIYAYRQGHAVQTLRSTYAGSILVRTKDGRYVRPLIPIRPPSPTCDSTGDSASSTGAVCLSDLKKIRRTDDEERKKMSNMELRSIMEETLKIIEELRPAVLVYSDFLSEYRSVRDELEARMPLVPPILVDEEEQRDRAPERQSHTNDNLAAGSGEIPVQSDSPPIPAPTKPKYSMALRQ